MVKEKVLDRGRNIYFAFLDLNAAFDSVPRQEICNALQEKRIPPNLIAIKSAYQDPKGVVRLNGMKSSPFRFYKGVKQREGLSPLLFNIVMDEVLKACKRRTPRAIIGQWNMLPVQAQCFVYADDIVVVEDDSRKEISQKRYSRSETCKGCHRGTPVQVIWACMQVGGRAQSQVADGGHTEVAATSRTPENHL